MAREVNPNMCLVLIGPDQQEMLAAFEAIPHTGLPFTVQRDGSQVEIIVSPSFITQGMESDTEWRFNGRSQGGEQLTGIFWSDDGMGYIFFGKGTISPSVHRTGDPGYRGG